MSTSVSTLGDSGWLIHVQNVLAGAAWIAARVAKESASVLVHCRLEKLLLAQTMSKWHQFWKMFLSFVSACLLSGPFSLPKFTHVLHYHLKLIHHKYFSCAFLDSY